MSATVSPPAIHAAGLRKSYGTQVVLDGIDLDVPVGTVYALVGPNGAGKTTTVHILSTLIAADGGRVEVCPAQVRVNFTLAHPTVPSSQASISSQATGKPPSSSI
jgi:ABC-2 type transport system ATP-binding protein